MAIRTKEQLAVLLKYVQVNNTSLTRKNASNRQKTWAVIAEKLNEMPGPKKDIDSWKRCYYTFRLNAGHDFEQEAQKLIKEVPANNDFYRIHLADENDSDSQNETRSQIFENDLLAKQTHRFQELIVMHRPILVSHANDEPLKNQIWANMVNELNNMPGGIQLTEQQWKQRIDWTKYSVRKGKKPIPYETVENSSQLLKNTIVTTEPNLDLIESNMDAASMISNDESILRESKTKRSTKRKPYEIENSSTKLMKYNNVKTDLQNNKKLDVINSQTDVFSVISNDESIIEESERTYSNNHLNLRSIETEENDLVDELNMLQSDMDNNDTENDENDVEHNDYLMYSDAEYNNTQTEDDSNTELDETDVDTVIDQMEFKSTENKKFKEPPLAKSFKFSQRMLNAVEAIGEEMKDLSKSLMSMNELLMEHYKQQTITNELLRRNTQLISILVKHKNKKNSQ